MGIPSSLTLLEDEARKSEQVLARQRQLIEDLRADGHRTTEAEEVLRRYEVVHEGRLAKLETLLSQQTGD